MDRKKLVLLVVGLIVAIGTAFTARSMFAGAAAPEAMAQTAPVGPKVLVANRALPAGTIITADAIGFQQWPDNLVKDAYYLEGASDLSKLLGTVVRFPITAGEPVTQGALVSPGDRGFLAAALGPGMRAVTVPVSAMTGVGGFVFPGDRVDLVLTQSVGSDGPDKLNASETIVKNLRVLATDQSTETQKDESGKIVVTEFQTVTLEVTPRIAEKVAVAQSIGTLSLSLRSLADTSGGLEDAIAAGDVKIPDNATPAQEEALLRRAMARPTDKGSTYVTGGDVSRFQRRTLPPRQSTSMPSTAVVPAPAGSPQVVVQPAAPVPTGPMVRVSRGKETTEEAVGKNGRVLTGTTTPTK